MKFLLIFPFLIGISIGNETIHYSNYNCTSAIIGYMASPLSLIKNCTEIRGSLVINRINVDEDINEYIENNEISKYIFVNLREITEYLIVYNVNNLPSLEYLFPNLVMIRGNSLFHNYALAIYDNPDLKEIGLKSLLSIPRGNVFIDHCPELCNLDKIFWNRLTLMPGNNWIQYSNITDCPKCEGCINCWDTKHCQFFEGHDMINMMKSRNCDGECFGGCYKESSNENCNICKNFKEKNKCVKRCSENFYAYHLDMRCYTAEVCINNKKGLLFQNNWNECVTTCPYGFKKNDTICVECSNISNPECFVECSATRNDIDSIERVDKLKGCHVINGSLTVRILDPIDDSELEAGFGEIRIIKGFLRVYDSPHIKSLNFFKNLEIVEGDPNYSKHFGILIYENKNLTSLWNLNHVPKIKILDGGIYIDSNVKLCNWEIQLVQKNISHKKDYDFIFYNDEEIFCSQGIFEIKAQPISSHTLMVMWTDLYRSKSIEIFYRQISKDSTLILDDELQKDICLRISWNKINLKNYNFTNYNITNLIENTKYVIIVKLLSKMDSIIGSVQSKTIYAETMSDIPKPPNVFTTMKTSNSIELDWDMTPYKNQNLTKVFIDIYKISDNQTELNKRDFCEKVPQYFSINKPAFERDINENQTKCLYGKVTEAQETEEFDRAIKMRFDCSIETPKACDNLYDDPNQQKMFIPKKFLLRRIVLKTTKGPKNILNLSHATLYLFKVFICNKYGCSTYTLHYNETNRINDSNTINNITLIPSSYNKYQIKIKEPEKPNGIILNYKILFEPAATPTTPTSTNTYPIADNETNIITSKFFCFRSIEMAEKNFTFDYDIKFNFSISVLSTSGDGYWSPMKGFNDFNITAILNITSETLSTNSGTVSIEVIVTLIILIVIGGFSWLTYRKHPKLKTIIYYNVKDDQVNLINDEHDNMSNNEEIEEMVTIQLQKTTMRTDRDRFRLN